MDRIRRAAMACLVAAAPVSLAAAQAPRPAVEIGAAAGGIFTQVIDFDGDGLSSGQAELRVSVPLTDRFALEGGLMIAPGGQNCCYKKFEGFYSGQIRQRLTADRGPGVFLTYGLAGYLARESRGELRFPQPDGSIIVSPPYHHTAVEAPYVTLVGLGFDHPVTPRVSLRADVQSMSVLWIPLGVRASAGVSFGFGRR